MRQEKSSSSRKEDAGDKLIQAGAFSYIEAMVALADFRTEVQDRCSAVMRAHLKQLGSGTARGLSDKDISVWPEPKSKCLSTYWPIVYSYVTLIPDKVYFDLGLHWEHKDENKVTLFAFGALEIFDAGFLARACNALEKSPGVELVMQYFVSIRHAIPENAPLSFQDELGVIAKKWGREFERARGLAGLIGTRIRPLVGKKG